MYLGDGYFHKMDKQKVKQIFEREIERHSKEIERHKEMYEIRNSKKQLKKMQKHFHKKFQTILLAKEMGFNFCECCGSLYSHQIKKVKDDGSNDSLSVDTNLLQGKNYKDEQMLVGKDNKSGENNRQRNKNANGSRNTMFNKTGATGSSGKHLWVEYDVIARDDITNSKKRNKLATGSRKEISKGFKKGNCKCGNTYGYWGLDLGYCVGCLDDMEEEE